MSVPALQISGVRIHAEAQPLDLKLEIGQTLVVLGGNGSGKSRLLSAILGQFDAGGEIEIFGIPVHRKSSRRRALAGVGVLFQESGLLRDLTARENVALPGRIRERLSNAANDADVDTLLALLRCEPFADTYPSELSAGEARRVALARSIAGDSRLLLVDEPLAGLSEDGRQEIATLLKTLLKEGVIEALALFTEDRQLAAEFAATALVLGRDRDIFGIPCYETIREAG